MRDWISTKVMAPLGKVKETPYTAYPINPDPNNNPIMVAKSMSISFSY